MADTLVNATKEHQIALLQACNAMLKAAEVVSASDLNLDASADSHPTKPMFEHATATKSNSTSDTTSLAHSQSHSNSHSYSDEATDNETNTNINTNITSNPFNRSCSGNNYINHSQNQNEIIRNSNLGSSLFTRQEQEILKQIFLTNKYPSKCEMADLASRFGKPLSKLRTWFNNRRAKLSRKMEGEGEGERGFGLVERRMRTSPMSEEAKEKIRPTATDKDEDADITTTPFRCIKPNSFYNDEENNSSPESVLPHDFDTKTARRAKEIGISTQLPMAPTSSIKSSRKTPPATIVSRSRLTIGDTLICESLDSGNANTSKEGDKNAPFCSMFEIKFLYGRRKLRYEMFLGEDPSKAQELGGPYGCMDIPFEAIESFTFEQHGKEELSIEVDCKQIEFYSQPEYNFEEYRNRTKQRMYEASQHGDFTPNRVATQSKVHTIGISRSQMFFVKTKLQESLGNESWETRLLKNPASQFVTESDSSPTIGRKRQLMDVFDDEVQEAEACMKRHQQEPKLSIRRTKEWHQNSSDTDDDFQDNKIVQFPLIPPMMLSPWAISHNAMPMMLGMTAPFFPSNMDMPALTFLMAPPPPRPPIPSDVEDACE